MKHVYLIDPVRRSGGLQIVAKTCQVGQVGSYGLRGTSPLRLEVSCKELYCLIDFQCGPLGSVIARDPRKNASQKYTILYVVVTIYLEISL